MAERSTRLEAHSMQLVAACGVAGAQKKGGRQMKPALRCVATAWLLGESHLMTCQPVGQEIGKVTLAGTCAEAQ